MYLNSEHSFFLCLAIGLCLSHSWHGNIELIKKDDYSNPLFLELINSGIVTLVDSETPLPTCEKQLKNCEAIGSFIRLRNTNLEDRIETLATNCNELFIEGQIALGGYIAQDVDHCSGVECFRMATDYQRKELDQMFALKELSTKCSQNITFDCVRARINHGDEHYLTWVDINGDVHKLTGMFKCNANSALELQDVITLHDKDLLPITFVSYGPMEDRTQKAKIQVGPLTCKKDFHKTVRKLKEQMAFAQFPTSCVDLITRGFFNSGEYPIDFDGSNQGEDPVNAYCDFTLMKIFGTVGASMLGTPSVSNVGKCEDEGCFVMDITYESMGQLKSMMKRVPLCKQSIAFQCLTTRYNATCRYCNTGYYNLTWMDAEGNLHKEDLPKCNGVTDTYLRWSTTAIYDQIEIIGNQSLLPIKSVYSGLLHSWQQAKIFVGPVICPQRIPSGCPPGWKLFHKSCYHFSTHADVSYGANVYCHELDRHSYVLEIESQEEHGFVIQNIVDSQWKYWIGSFNFDQNGVRRWSFSRRPMLADLVDWDQTIEHSKEHCIYFDKQNGGWVIAFGSCFDHNRIICKKNLHKHF